MLKSSFNIYNCKVFVYVVLFFLVFVYFPKFSSAEAT